VMSDPMTISLTPFRTCMSADLVTTQQQHISAYAPLAAAAR